jgi:glycine cleavage system aminomethyltransferase T
MEVSTVDNGTKASSTAKVFSTTEVVTSTKASLSLARDMAMAYLQSKIKVFMKENG